MAKKSSSRRTGGVNKTEAIRAALASNPAASPAEIAAQLTAEGIEVSANYVSNVKSTSKSKGRGKGKKRGRRGRSAGGVSKSQAIRDALAKDPNVSPTRLAEELQAQGLSVTAAYVSTIKTNMKSEGGTTATTREPRRAAAAASSSDGSFAATELFEAKRFLDQVGSIEKAQSLLSVLKKLQ